MLIPIQGNGLLFLIAFSLATDRVGEQLGPTVGFVGVYARGNQGPGARSGW